ncbi:hypothetical protein HMPREF0663_11879 [Hoylesella oralis ATCC 33269]|uniref:Uncharacterized protein n=1 Tax=Hoylesella oralis ATCC 33269 TaxID=873533 RepID=E7RRS8_9BACT|nr:hypothetical protein [Hoylesella oralis]EFZ36966.1 hypothetical protein HMPREF0663_11879 [Hoylesella oralis ATCC 33269]EPH18691.1 hypothetical protein HMPREF1475_00599 [Hoylesella oralis HGA0225]SHF77721.1 hypothetical protein SAMN05444288_1514 [Hoylesella oralis]
MEKKIFVSEKAKAHLRKVFKCTNPMVWKALNFKSDSELARKIRFTALQQLGGVANWKPEEVETTHEETARTMTLHFGNRVQLVYDRNDGSTRVLVDGRECRREQRLDIPEFMALSHDVEQMAMSL